MQRAHKIRLNPTPEQEVYFRKAAGTARFVYNWGLKEVKRALDDGRKPESPLDLKVRFNAIKREQFPWVYEVTKCAAEGAFHNGCGGYREDLDLADRVWVCPACYEVIDRDLNAARNIRDEALRLSASPVVATSGCEDACGRHIRPADAGGDG